MESNDILAVAGGVIARGGVFKSAKYQPACYPICIF